MRKFAYKMQDADILSKGTPFKWGRRSKVLQIKLPFWQKKGLGTGFENDAMSTRDASSMMKFINL